MLALRIKRNNLVGTRQNIINNTCLFIIFSLLFLVSALRGHVGNDYDAYIGFMHEAKLFAYTATEIGFDLIVYVIYTLCGFENYRLVFAVFSFITVFFFVREIYRESEDMFTSFAMFMLLCPYFQSFSTVRYYAALALVFHANAFFQRKDYIGFVVTVLIASTIHKTALLVLIFYPMAKIRFNKYIIGIGLVFTGILAALPSLWLKIALVIFPTYKTDGAQMGDISSPINIIRNVLVLLLVYFCTKEVIFKKADTGEHNEDEKQLEKIRFYTRLSIMALAIHIGGYYLPQLSRITIYMTLFQIFLIPSVIKRLKDKKRRQLATAAVLAVCSLVYIRFMMLAHGNGISVLPYTSFLFE